MLTRIDSELLYHFILISNLISILSLFFFFFALDPFLKLILFFFLILLFNIRLLKFEFHNFFLCGDSGLIIQVECIKC
jgi:hypothetical protein